MKLPCEIMDDLLPLYAEKMTTDVTRTAVDEHLRECSRCRERLAALRGEPHETPEVPLERLRKALLRRRLTVAATAALLAAAALLTVFAALFVPAYVPYAEGIVHTATDTASPDGTLEYVFLGGTRLDEQRFAVPEGGEEIIVTMWNTALDVLTGQDTRHGIAVPPEDTLWYADISRGGELVLLQGSPEADGGVLLPRLTLGYYLLAALIGAAVLAALAVLTRRTRAGRPLRFAAEGCLCYAAAHALVFGTATLSYRMAFDFVLICLLALALWGAALGVERLIRQERRDRS